MGRMGYFRAVVWTTGVLWSIVAHGELVVGRPRSDLLLLRSVEAKNPRIDGDRGRGRDVRHNGRQQIRGLGGHLGLTIQWAQQGKSQVRRSTKTYLCCWRRRPVVRFKKGVTHTPCPTPFSGSRLRWTRKKRIATSAKKRSTRRRSTHPRPTKTRNKLAKPSRGERRAEERKRGPVSDGFLRSR